jgi:hypothetical protein
VARRRRSPREKKELSYRKDRRNGYGENDKSSRRAIARNKRIGHRADRHRGRQGLAGALGRVDEHAATRAERRVSDGSRRRWRKSPDIRLGEHVEAQLSRRVRAGMSAPDVEAARIAKVRRALGADAHWRRRVW